MLNVPIPPMDAFRLGEKYQDLVPEGYQQILSENGATIGPCTGCRRKTMAVVTSARMNNDGDVSVCSHRICAACRSRWPGCPDTWDEATLSLISLASPGENE